MMGVKLLELPLVQLCERQSVPPEPAAEVPSSERTPGGRGTLQSYEYGMRVAQRRGATLVLLMHSCDRSSSFVSSMLGKDPQRETRAEPGSNIDIGIGTTPACSIYFFTAFAIL